MQDFQDIDPNDFNDTLIVYDHEKCRYKLIEPTQARLFLKMWQKGQLNTLDPGSEASRVFQTRNEKQDPLHQYHNQVKEMIEEQKQAVKVNAQSFIQQYTQAKRLALTDKMVSKEKRHFWGGNGAGKDFPLMDRQIANNSQRNIHAYDQIFPTSFLQQSNSKE